MTRSRTIAGEIRRVSSIQAPYRKEQGRERVLMKSRRSILRDLFAQEEQRGARKSKFFFEKKLNKTRGPNFFLFGKASEKKNFYYRVLGSAL